MTVLAAVHHCPPKAGPSDGLLPGDFILCRASQNKGKGGATTVLGQAIQAGERTRYGDTDWARWTHCALVVSADGEIIEAIEKGVCRSSIDKYRDSDYMHVSPHASAKQRALAVAFAKAHEGASYGIVNFAGLVIQSLFGVNLALHMDSQFICSGLVSRATEKYIVTYPRSPENMMPGDLAHYWGAQSGEPSVRPGWVGRNLTRLATFVRMLIP